jgi:hypothetical protein
MLKKLHWFAAPVVAAALVLAAGAQPVQAADGYDRCPSGYFCIFGDSNGQGRFAYFQCMSPDLSKIGDGIDDMTSSVWNNSYQTFRVWSGYNYTGSQADFGSGAKGNIPLEMNDKISSLRALTPTCL